MSFVIYKNLEFELWLAKQPPKARALIEGRLAKISETGHFGKSPNKYKVLGRGLEELKFHDQNGMRVYFARTGKNEITLLLGGYKNGQKKDIKKARNYLLR